MFLIYPSVSWSSSVDSIIFLSDSQSSGISSLITLACPDYVWSLMFSEACSILKRCFNICCASLSAIGWFLLFNWIPWFNLSI